MTVKRGTTRTVVLVGAYAIKLPCLAAWARFLQGLLANMQEVTFSETGWPELCPVLWHLPGGFLTVMPRAQTLTERLPVEQYLALTQHSDRTIPAENKPCSWGYLPDGRLVAVDYG